MSSNEPAVYVDDLLAFTTSDLSRLGYLKNGWQRGQLLWHINGQEAGDIGISSSVGEGSGVVFLNYTFKGESISNRIELTTLPSNLGRGKVWYFVCPHTGQRCRKLFHYFGTFCSRKALGRVLYQCQTESKLWRTCHPPVEAWPTSRPKYYAGEITKGYVRHLNKQQKYLAGLREVVGRLSSKKG